MNLARRFWLLLLGLAALAAGAWASAPPQLVRLSHSPAGDAARTWAGASTPTISRDGAYVLFLSNSSSFGTDPHGWPQLWRRERATGNLELVSHSPSGDPANGPIGAAVISADGQSAVWASSATNLLPGLNGAQQVFLHDFQQNTTELISVANGGGPGDLPSGAGVAVSSDGTYVAFSTYADNLLPNDNNAVADVYLRNRGTHTTERISVAAFNGEPNGDSGLSGLAVSDTGQFVGFQSDASNLVNNDTNGSSDVFVRDRNSGTTERVSVAEGGAQADAPSAGMSISGNGRYVAFLSTADNMLPAQTTPTGIYVRDRTGGHTTLISQTPGGNPAAGNYRLPVMSPDGRFVLFGSDSSQLVAGDTNGREDLFLRDRGLSRTEMVSNVSGGGEFLEATLNDDSYGLSVDGSSVVFATASPHLVSGDTNGRTDVFVRDRTDQVWERESVTSTGDQGYAPATTGGVAVSNDGRYVAFVSDAINLLATDSNGAEQVFVYDRYAATLELASVTAAGDPSDAVADPDLQHVPAPAITPDGRYVAFISASANLVSGDTNSAPDLFIRDRVAGTTIRAGLSSAGAELSRGVWPTAGPSISADGRYVTFISSSPELTRSSTGSNPDVYVRDRTANATELISVTVDGNPSVGTLEVDSTPRISADGRLVVFSSGVSNLVRGDTNGAQDVFVRDRSAQSTDRASLNSNSQQVHGTSVEPAISSDGRFVVFRSYAADLVPGVATGYSDIFLRDLVGQSTVRVDLTSTGAQPALGAYAPTVSDDGRFVLFASASPDVVPGGISVPNLYQRDRTQNTTVLVSAANDGNPGNGPVASSAMSGDGATISFGSAATNLADGDAAGEVGLYLSAPDQGTAPGPVTNVAATAVGVGTIRLTWQPTTSNVVGFQIERQDSSPFHLIATVPSGTTSYQDSGLTPDTSYTYRIRSSNGFGNSGYSTPVSATALPAIPAAPTGLTATPLSLSAVLLNWNDQSTNESSYIVRRAVGAGAPSTLATLPANSVRFTDTHPVLNQAVTYSVVAHNSAGDSAPATTTLTLQASGKLVITPAKLKFPAVKVGKSKTLKLKLKNVGTTPLMGSLGSVSAPFTASGAPTTFYIGGRGTLTISVTFTPTARGKATGSLAITTTDPAAQSKTVSITGTGH